MRPDTRTWLAGLQDFAAEHRERRPLFDGAKAAPAAAAERSILGAHLATRLAEVDALLAARRQRVAETDAEIDPDPVLVLTTSPPGAAAAAALLDPRGGPFAELARQLVVVTELEYRLWCIRAPDEGRRLHVNLWNWVKTRVPPQRHAEFARHPLAEGETYWLHRTGVVGAGAADAHACHLWKWNGRQASPLEAFVTEGVRGRGVAEA